MSWIFCLKTHFDVYIYKVSEESAMLVTVAFQVASWGVDAWWLGIFQYTSSHGFAQLLKRPQIFFSHSFILYSIPQFRFIGQSFPYITSQVMDTSRPSPFHWKKKMLILGVEEKIYMFFVIQWFENVQRKLQIKIKLFKIIPYLWKVKVELCSYNLTSYVVFAFSFYVIMFLIFFREILFKFKCSKHVW